MAGASAEAAASFRPHSGGWSPAPPARSAAAVRPDFLQQQVQLSHRILQQAVIFRGAGRITGLLGKPAGLDGAEPLGQPGGSLVDPDAVQFGDQHGHADRARPQGPAQVGLGAAAEAQPVFEEALQLVELLRAEGGGGGGNPRTLPLPAGQGEPAIEPALGPGADRRGAMGAA